VLRDEDGPGLREYLIATAARLIAERGTAGLAVRDIAREAQVADGVLYNYFEDKEDLLTHALLAHVGSVMAAGTRMPAAGTGTVADNLREFIDAGFGVLSRVAPAFAGLLAQPKVLSRFHAIVGGDPAFVGDGERGEREERETGETDETGEARETPRGLPALLTDYLAAEQRLGRVDRDADMLAAGEMVIAKPVGGLGDGGDVLYRCALLPARMAIDVERQTGRGQPIACCVRHRVLLASFPGICDGKRGRCHSAGWQPDRFLVH